MQNHLHVLALETDPDEARKAMGAELSAWTRRFYPTQEIWSLIPIPVRIPDLQNLKRQIRYVHLNPCRAGLVKDPLSWEWSTHRDVTGCVSKPWPDFRTLMRVFESSKAQLGETMHRYISADPSTSVTGTPMIRAPLKGGWTSVDSSFVFAAAAAVRREEMIIQKGKLRELAVQTAHYLNLRPDLKVFKMSQRSWRRATLRQKNEADIQSVLKLLADPRTLNSLRHFTDEFEAADSRARF